MHAQRYARLYLLDVLAEAIEGLHGDVARVVSEPLRVHRDQRPAIRQRRHPQVFHRSEHCTHGVAIIVVPRDEICVGCSSLDQRPGEPIRLNGPVLYNVARDDHDIDVCRKRVHHEREVLGWAVAPGLRARVTEQMGVAQLSHQHERMMPGRRALCESPKTHIPRDECPRTCAPESRPG